MNNKRLFIIIVILGVLIIFGLIYFTSFNVKYTNSKFENAKIDAINGNFGWITNLIYDDQSYSLSQFKEVVSRNEYTARQFYNVFNELSFISTTPEVSCIQEKENPRCIYFNAILTNNEGLCNNFPEEKKETITGKYGSYERIAYYRDSCILFTRIYSTYLNSDNKVEFCNSFGEDYIKESCLFYFETPQRDFSTLS